jgi:hypothetical protein
MAAANVSELYMACRNGDIVTVKRLLSNTPLEVINRIEPNGKTCLHAASAHDRKEIVRLLLQKGATRRVTDRHGRTPLDEARTDEIRGLFRRSQGAATTRYSSNPIQQPEWQFEDTNAESYSRAIHWGSLKDRGLKKTVKELQKSPVLVEDGDVATEVVRNLFRDALATNNPVLLLKAYTVESQFYKRLNREMATGNRREVYKKLCKKWTGYYTGIIARNPAFQRLRYAGETYRGMEITQSDFAQYKPGVALANKSFQSTSKSWKIAKGFACPSSPTPGKLPVVLIFTIIDQRSALSIEDISEFQHEEEVLIIPGTLFIVTEVYQDVVPYEIELRQLEWTNEF